MAEKLTRASRETRLPSLEATGWQAVAGKDAIRKIWKFRSFAEAWAFMSRVALLAEKADHHPDWSNRYNIVDLTLTTHSVKGLSALDLDMAEKIDAFAPDAKILTDHGAPLLSLCEEKHQNG